jgi:hypothetical protein
VENDELRVVACCGNCGGDISMVACPIHHWTVVSLCAGCGATHLVDATCKECDWPRSGAMVDPAQMRARVYTYAELKAICDRVIDEERGDDGGISEDWLLAALAKMLDR